ncbi:MAG TPA: flavodoxin family protein [Desulfomonilia bacterium]|nr:flavodoxin family protein [Desulfomonilia bacterium]
MEKKKLTGIVGSSRRLGNAEIVAKAIGEGLGEGWDLSLIRLPHLRIQPCKGCYACLQPGTSCNLQDDMAWLLDRLCEADALVVAVPDYILGPVGMVKMLTDRALQALARGTALWKKRTVVALTLGREEYRGYADTALIAQVAGLGLDVVGTECFYGTHPGEAAIAVEFQEKIDHLAGALLGDERASVEYGNRCPRCLSDLFRTHPQGLECAVCKSLAERKDDGSLHFFFFHPEFSEEGQIEHINWLQMKKAEYPHLKNRLKAVQSSYQGGTWLSPPQAQTG